MRGLRLRPAEKRNHFAAILGQSRRGALVESLKILASGLQDTLPPEPLISPRLVQPGYVVLLLCHTVRSLPNATTGRTHKLPDRPYSPWNREPSSNARRKQAQYVGHLVISRKPETTHCWATAKLLHPFLLT